MATLIRPIEVGSLTYRTAKLVPPARAKIREPEQDSGARDLSRNWASITEWPARLLIVAFAVVAMYSISLGLNGEVRYVIGALAAYDGDAPLTLTDTFTHRPLAYRLAISVVMAIPRFASIEITNYVPYEIAVRLLAVVAATGTGALLWLSLRRWVGHVPSLAVGFAVALTLAIPFSWDLLQAEWFATISVCFAVATTLGPRNPLLGAGLGGLFVMLAAAVKIVTLPYAGLALICIALIDLRRSFLAAATGFLWGIAWLALSSVVDAEFPWLRDMAALNPNSILRATIDDSYLEMVFSAVGSQLAAGPYFVLLPAGTLLLTRTIMRPRTRRAVGVVVVAAVSLAVMPLVIQGYGFPYHMAALPVLAAATVAAGIARSWCATGHPPALMLLALPVVSVAQIYLLGLPSEWREIHAGLVIWLLIVASVLLAYLVARTRRQRALRAPRAPFNRGPLALLWVGVLAGLGPALFPSSAWSLDPRFSIATNADWAESSASYHEEVSSIREQIGPNTLVLYLAWGEVAYHMGNPTDCRYPSPLFLQRSIYFPWVVELQSYAENARCITATDAEFAIVQPGWIAVRRLATHVRDSFIDRFECRGARRSAGLLVCPRR